MLSHVGEVLEVGKEAEPADAPLDEHPNHGVRLTAIAIRIGFESLAARVVRLEAHATVLVLNHRHEPDAMTRCLCHIAGHPTHLLTRANIGVAGGEGEGRLPKCAKQLEPGICGRMLEVAHPIGRPVDMHWVQDA